MNILDSIPPSIGDKAPVGDLILVWTWEALEILDKGVNEENGYAYDYDHQDKQTALWWDGEFWCNRKTVESYLEHTYDGKEQLKYTAILGAMKAMEDWTDTTARY